MPAAASRTSLPFHCPDGEDVENRILRILESASDVTSGSPELAGAATDWPALIHLSPERRNLLIPVRHLLRGRILEPGAGYGALTRFLGETGADVTAIESSARRSEAVSARCRDLPNVRVVNNAFLNWQTADAFDTVVAAGFPGHSRDTLKRIHDLLAPGGALILAIDNQVGLKYLAGEPEDHAGEPYFGVNDLYPGNTPATFGKAELEKMLRQSGFAQVQFSYPFPDYRLPSLIVESAAVRHPVLDIAAIIRYTLARQAHPQNGPALDQAAAFGVLLRNGLLEDLANSFLVVARKEGCDAGTAERRPLVHLFATNRNPHFQKVTLFEECAAEIVVRREALNDAPPAGGSGYRRRFTDETYLRGVPWVAGLESIVRNRGWTVEDVAVWARPWIEFLRSNCADDEPARLPPHFIDCTPFNVLHANNVFYPFDLEYESDRPVYLDAVVFRGLWQSLARMPRCAAPDTSVPQATLDVVTSIMAGCDMAVGQNRVNELVLQEAELQAAVRGFPVDATLRAFAVERLPVPSDVVHHPRANHTYKCQVYWRGDDELYDESRSSEVRLTATRVMERLDLGIPPLDCVRGLRLDLADRTGVLEVAAITLTDLRGHQIRNWSASEIAGAFCHGMRCVPNGGDYDGVTVFAFTDDPALELPVDSSVSVGCIQGGLLRVVCRWPVEHDPMERTLRNATELFRAAFDTNSEIQEQIASLNERIDRVAEGITRTDDIKTEIARISEAQDRLLHTAARPKLWWKRNK
jgi:SAM-dependent methyltransferase